MCMRDKRSLFQSKVLHMTFDCVANWPIQRDYKSMQPSKHTVIKTQLSHKNNIKQVAKYEVYCFLFCKF